MNLGFRCAYFLAALLRFVTLLPCFASCYLASMLRFLLPCFLPCFPASFLASLLVTLLPCFASCYLAAFPASLLPSLLRFLLPCFLASLLVTLLRSLLPCFLPCFLPPWLRFLLPFFLASFLPGFFPCFLASFLSSLLNLVHDDDKATNRTPIYANVFTWTRNPHVVHVSVFHAVLMYWPGKFWRQNIFFGTGFTPLPNGAVIWEVNRQNGKQQSRNQCSLQFWRIHSIE